jgi:hypothetical protein
MAAVRRFIRASWQQKRRRKQQAAHHDPRPPGLGGCSLQSGPQGNARYAQSRPESEAASKRLTTAHP